MRPKRKENVATFLSPPTALYFEALRRFVVNSPQEENKPPFMIFSDMTLHEMVHIRPQTLDELLTVSGVGQHKLAHYGEHFLKVLCELEDNSFMT